MNADKPNDGINSIEDTVNCPIRHLMTNRSAVLARQVVKELERMEKLRKDCSKAKARANGYDAAKEFIKYVAEKVGYTGVNADGKTEIPLSKNWYDGLVKFIEAYSNMHQEENVLGSALRPTEEEMRDLEQTIRDQETKLKTQERNLQEFGMQIKAYDAQVKEMDAKIAAQEAKLKEQADIISARDEEFNRYNAELEKAAEKLKGITARAEGLSKGNGGN